MIEQIKSNFKLWSQTIARTIENSIPGVKAKFDTLNEKSLIFTYDDVRMAFPVRVLREMYEEEEADIMDITCAILNLAEEVLGVQEDEEEIADSNRFYEMIQHKLNLCDSMNWVCDYFIPMKDVYVSLVEDAEGVMYECIWYKQKDKFIINKY